MKKICLFIFAILLSATALAQEDPPDKTCNFLPALKYRNGTDTVTINSVYRGIVRAAPVLTQVIDRIDKLRKIRKREFAFILFYPERCDGEFSCLISLNDWSRSTDLDLADSTGKLFKIQLVVFKEYKGDYPTMPYFIVTKATLAK